MLKGGCSNRPHSPTYQADTTTKVLDIPIDDPTQKERANVVNIAGAPTLGSQDILDLPPEAAPYVIILTGVPTLTEHSRESWGDLKNKCMFWLNNKLSEPRDLSHGINMVRRVNWVGRGNKKIKGDCVVVNFKSLEIVEHILNRIGSRKIETDTISVVPLGFFYRPLDWFHKKTIHAGGWAQTRAVRNHRLPLVDRHDYQYSGITWEDQRRYYGRGKYGAEEWGKVLPRNESLFNCVTTNRFRNFADNTPLD